MRKSPPNVNQEEMGPDELLRSKPRTEGWRGASAIHKPLFQLQNLGPDINKFAEQEERLLRQTLSEKL